MDDLLNVYVRKSKEKLHKLQDKLKKKFNNN